MIALGIDRDRCGWRFSLALGLVLCAWLVGSPVAFADLYAVTEAGTVFASTDEGVIWTEQGRVIEPEIEALRPSADGAFLYLLGRTGDFYRSTDAGATWQTIGNANASGCIDLAVGADESVWVLTETGDLLASSDGGANWTFVSNAGFSDGTAFSATGGDSLFAVTRSGDVAFSEDAAIWLLVGNTGFSSMVDLIWSEGMLWAMTLEGELLRSGDLGVSWDLAGTLSQYGVRGVTRTQDGAFRAITREGDVAGSPDGVGWTWIGTVNQVYVSEISPDRPESPSQVPETPQVLSTLRLDLYPNPFSTRLSISLEGTTLVGPTEVSVFDAAGRRVARFPSRDAMERHDSRTWDAKGMAPGTYFVLARSRSARGTRKVVLMR